MSSTRSGRKKARTNGSQEDDVDTEIVVTEIEGLEALKKRVEEEKIEKLGGAIEVDLDHLLRSVQGLLATNKEISTRVTDHATCDKVGNFTRYEFGSTVHVEPPAHFSVSLCRTLKNFGTLPKIPSQLVSLFNLDDLKTKDSIFRVSNLDDLKTTDGILPDYDAVFHNALILSPAVQGSFLSLFKSHLEAVQVYLGQVDDWIMEGIDSYENLKDIFGERKNNDETFMGEEEGTMIPSLVPFSRSQRFSTIELKSFPNEDGAYEKSFDISCEKGKRRLEKFLEYMYLSCDD